MEERLQKILARAGLGSRRACEELVSEGRVSVNGQTATLGSKADAQKDAIRVDGRLVQVEEAPVYIALYKPRGILSAAESPEGRKTVRDLIPLPGRLYPVGRLDLESEGLILMTNDGELANRLTHPRFGHEKEYQVLVARRPDDEQLATWRRGVVLEDGHRTAPAEVRVDAPFGKGAWLQVILREGRKRQIRETGTQIGLPVVRIIRTRIGTLKLGSLKPYEWRHLTEDEVAALKGQPGKARPSPEPGSSVARPGRPGTKPVDDKPRARRSGVRPENRGPNPGKSGSRPGKGGGFSRPRRATKKGKPR